MFNIGTGMENVTHLKSRTLLQYGAFKCGPASEPLARHEDALLRPWEIVLGIKIKFSDVNQCFRSLDFRDFLEKHLHFFIRYLVDISKYSQNATRQYYQILFYRKSSHTAIYIALCGKIK